MFIPHAHVLDFVDFYLNTGFLGEFRDKLRGRIIIGMGREINHDRRTGIFRVRDRRLTKGNPLCNPQTQESGQENRNLGVGD